jgi:hypothetical protein
MIPIFLTFRWTNSMKPKPEKVDACFLKIRQWNLSKMQRAYSVTNVFLENMAGPRRQNRCSAGIKLIARAPGHAFVGSPQAAPRSSASLWATLPQSLPEVLRLGVGGNLG